MEIQTSTPARHVALVTIANQPRRNAMSRAMLADLAALWDRLEADADCRAVIVTGAGDKAFSAGADISGDLSASEGTAHVINRALLKDTPFTKPIIAAINGDCVGGGIELLLSTDIRATVPEARFGLPEVKWSIYPFGGATVKLAQQIGHVHAMDLLLTGRLVDAEFAARINLVNVVVERDRIMPWALSLAETIAGNSPSAVQAVKEAISTAIADYAKSREALEQALGDRVRSGPHFAEGIAAFRDKRRPDYS
ncbi:MAG TPA: enoyl-CoA hydratase/isomerase family protein [Stellaceae bacterium]|jgi:enoyl-CoA hydratase/carnithine racemase|nr:enoyl-CoA hydratase/isomerase family protein [Stellaceae bacterium]